MNTQEKANKYADGKANDALTKAIAQAYLDGYKDGYKDGTTETSNTQPEYVDLGLPSGTLWANDYEKIDGEILYVSLSQSKHYHQLPTRAHWYELRSKCKFNPQRDSSGNLLKMVVTGPNGNTIEFTPTGYLQFNIKYNICDIYFWIGEAEAYIESFGLVTSVDIDKYEMPIRLVK